MVEAVSRIVIVGAATGKSSLWMAYSSVVSVEKPRGRRMITARNVRRRKGLRLWRSSSPPEHARARPLRARIRGCKGRPLTAGNGSKYPWRRYNGRIEAWNKDGSKWSRSTAMPANPQRRPARSARPRTPGYILSPIP